MKRAVVGVLAVLLLVSLIGRRHCGGDKTVSSSSKPSAATTQVGRAVPASARKVAVPAWLAQLDVKPRKVAGHVLFAGKPAAGATVRLALDAGFGVFQPVAELTTGADGAFDFGPQPGAQFNVSAEAPGKTSAELTLAIADPAAKPDQLVLVLGACESRLYGSVLDASGGAIAKAHVRTAGLAGADSDASGAYSVCVATNFSQVRVEADGYGTIDVGIRLFGELRYDFVLVPEAVLVGQVITETKQPVAGARVLALPDPSEGPHHIASGWALTEDDGRFRIPGLSPGHYRVTAAAEGMASAAPVDAMVQTGTATRDTIVVVTARARVSGHVVMGDRPIEGAVVSAALGGNVPHLFGQGVSAPAYSQADGSFVIQDAPLGIVSFAARPYDVTAPKQVEIKTAKLDGIKLEVAKLASIHGIVTRKGKPVTDAVLEGRGFPAAHSDANGAYTIDGLPPGEVRFYAWSLAHRAFATDKVVKLAAGEDKQVDVELELAGQVRGTVVDESGTPVPGVYVRLISDEGDVGESMTNGNGEFDAGTMAGGDYQPAVYPSPMAGQPFPPATGDRLDTIKVPRDGAVTGIKLAIKHEVLAISGTVVDEAGGPVADVHIEAIGRGKPGIDLPSIMSAADGTFRIRNLARGMYNLHAHASDGGEGDAHDISAGADGVVVKLIRPGAIEGTLVGFTQTPIVQMRTLTADLQIGGAPIVDGNRFWQTGVRPGKYTVEAKVGIEVAGESVEIRSGETAKVTLKARGSGHVEGRVLELETKAPLPAYRCDANLSVNGQMPGGPPSDPSQMGNTDDKGHFTMAAPIGMVRVFCFPLTGQATTVAGTDIEVTAQAVPNVEVYAVRQKAGAPGYAGFRIRPLVLPLVVNAVEPNSVAATQGLKVGDIIVAIDGTSMKGVLPAGAGTFVANHKPGSTVSVTVDRAGTPTTFKLPVTAAPD